MHPDNLQDVSIENNYVPENAKPERVIDKIALEEHFSIQELLPTPEEFAFFNPKIFENIEPLLPELSSKRLGKRIKLEFRSPFYLKLLLGSRV